MRLRRIEAVSYGALTDVTVGPLADGLTVVHGPNEAGKSTLISLVRHVLYGYPTQREKESGYFAPGGKRVGRLVFESEDGSWVIERTEAARGGDVQVRALSGSPRPTLAKDLVHGVSADAYRVVFGFGLDEMARVAEARAASDDDVLGRLYAASAGLRVSPQQVRAEVDAEAEALFKPTGRKRAINLLATELKAVRSEKRDLAREAEALIAEKGRSESLTAELARAREAREDARARLTALTLASDRADERVRVIEAQEELLLELRRERKRIDDERSSIKLDEALLAAAPDIEAVLVETGSLTASAESLAAAEAAAVRARTRAADAVGRTGLDAAALGSLAELRELASAVEEARAELQRLGATYETRHEAALKAGQALEQARAAAGKSLDPLGIDVGTAADVLGDRHAALDALESLRAGVGAGGARGAAVPALIMLISGLAAAVAGVVLREWVTAGIGVVLLAAGAWFLYRARAGAPALPYSDERPYLTMLGLDSSAGTLDLSRMRRSLDAARAAVERVSAVADTAAEAEGDANLARDALATRQALWESWLVGHGLDRTLSPAAAAGVVALVGEARREQAAVAEAEAEVDRITARLDTLAARVADTARPFVDVPLIVSREETAAIANRLAERLGTVRAECARHEEFGREIVSLDARIETEQARATRAAEELTEILQRFDLAEGGSHLELREMQAQATRQVAEAEEAFDAAAEARTQLEGQLERMGKERRADELRLAEAGLSERIASAADRYLVLAMASRLLAEAQERYGRERQPEVVKHAERVFSTITGGRYVGLSVPLGGGSIEAFDTRASVRRTDELSRGAAEQLYLALRVGLISQLGEVGVGLPVLMDDVFVNFDPPRKRGAVEAIVELAQARQVVFFTCHPETAALFAEAAPDLVRLELARVGD